MSAKNRQAWSGSARDIIAPRRSCWLSAESFGLEPEMALKLALGLEGGLGKTGEVCGAANGACIVLGLDTGAARGRPPQAGGRKLANSRVREFNGKFRERCGALACRELIGSEPQTPAPACLPKRAKRRVHQTLPGVCGRGGAEFWKKC